MKTAEQIPTKNASDLNLDDHTLAQSDVSVVSQMTAGEIEAQVATARRFPRDIRQFVDDVRTLACLTDDVAASCFYKLKRKEKDGTMKIIEGPSVRFAEIVATSYGNMRVMAKTTHDDAQFVYAQGTAMDMQRNVGVQIEVRRRITTSAGRRYGDDMVAVTANAAISIAARNAIFRVVPRAIWEPLLGEVRKVAIGDQKSFGERKQKMLEYFTQKVGISAEQLCAYLDIANLDAMTMEHLETLRGTATALKDGEWKLDEIFPPIKPEVTPAASQEAGTATPAAPEKTGLDALTEKLKAEQAPTTGLGGKSTPEPAPEPEPVAPPMTDAESKALDLELAGQDAVPPKKAARRR